MTVRAKPSNMFSNSNDNSCDGENLEGECLNSLITDLLDECGNGCSSGSCNDSSACNDGDIYVLLEFTTMFQHKAPSLDIAS